MTRFQKVFLTERAATEFIKLKGGHMMTRYDWDYIKNKLVKEFVVYY